jgi:outer membrane protein assembly factor BamA
VVSAPLAVSLQDGALASFLYRHKEEQGTARWLDEVRARGEAYLRVGPRVGFAYPVLALRGAVGSLDGPITDRFSVGGVSSGALQLGFGQSFGVFRTFPVRGYPAGTLHGRRAMSLTAEYRVPVALVGRSIGHLPLGADKLALAIFGDVGDAWDPGESMRLHRLRSVGAELIGDMTVSYDLLLRLRLGVAQPATGHARLYAAFGADF